MISAIENDLLQVEDLKLYFPINKGLIRKKVADIKAVDKVSFNIKNGETTATAIQIPFIDIGDDHGGKRCPFPVF